MEGELFAPDAGGLLPGKEKKEEKRTDNKPRKPDKWLCDLLSVEHRKKHAEDDSKETRYLHEHRAFDRNFEGPHLERLLPMDRGVSRKFIEGFREFANKHGLLEMSVESARGRICQLIAADGRSLAEMVAWYAMPPDDRYNLLRLPPPPGSSREQRQRWKLQDGTAVRDDAARTEDPRVFELQDGKAVSLCQTEYHETMTHTFYLPQSPDVEYGPVWIDASHHGPTEVWRYPMDAKGEPVLGSNQVNPSLEFRSWSRLDQFKYLRDVLAERPQLVVPVVGPDRKYYDPFVTLPRHPAAFIPATEFRGYRYGYVYKRLNRKDFDAWREHLPEVWQQRLPADTFGYRPHYKSEDLCVYDVQLPRYPHSDGSVGLITGYTWWSADYLRLGLQQDLRYIPETASVFRHDDIAEIFNRYDKDGSFGLDANELQQVLREVGIKGLTWRNVGKTAPENGIDLATETELMVDADALSRLAKGLQGKHTLVLQSGGSAQRGELETGATQQFTKQVVEFTTINFSQEEWNAIGGLFEGLKLRAAHFIKVGENYYQPIGEFEQGMDVLCLLLRSSEFEFDSPRLRRVRHRLHEHQAALLKMVQQQRHWQRRVLDREALKHWQSPSDQTPPGG